MLSVHQRHKRTDGQTDRQTDLRQQYRALHRAVKNYAKLLVLNRYNNI